MPRFPTMFMQREIFQLLHTDQGDSPALGSSLGGFIRMPMGILLKCKKFIKFTKFTKDCERNQKSSWLSKQEDANFQNLHMSLETFTTALSQHSFLAPAWPDGELISSPSSSYAKSLLEKWWCGFVFLFSCLCQAQQSKADSKAKHVPMSCAEPSNPDISEKVNVGCSECCWWDC